WSATPWLPASRSPLAGLRSSRRRAGAVMRDLADRLAAAPLGHTQPGWADAWLGDVDLISYADRGHLQTALRQLEEGLPTGWCHGDPWPANVLDAGGRPAVIDWGNASNDAPLGLDRVLLAAFDGAEADRVSFA